MPVRSKEGSPTSRGPFEDRETSSSDIDPGAFSAAMRVAAEPSPARSPSPGTETRYPRPAPTDADREGPPPGFGARAFSVAVDPAAVSVPEAERGRAFAAAGTAAAAPDERTAVGSTARTAHVRPLRRTAGYLFAKNADDVVTSAPSAGDDCPPFRDAVLPSYPPRFPGGGSRRARSASAASAASAASSVGSVASEDTYAEVGTLGLGGRRKRGERKKHDAEATSAANANANANDAFGFSPPRARRATRARASTRHRGLRGPRKTVFGGLPRELPAHAFAFFTEIFRLRGTILLKTVPQIVLAAVAGLFANVAKIAYCGEGVTSNEECDVTFNLDGHLGVSVVLSFLLVFRADLAWKRYESGKAALGAVHGGIRNLNVAAAVFLRRRVKARGDETADLADFDDDEEEDALAADRAEIFRLTNLLYAFVRHAARGQRHGYSDVGPVTDDELLTRDRGGKPRVPDLFLDAEEAREFRALDAWNRPNACASKISAIVEHKRRVGCLGERAAMDAFRDLRVVLDALKSMERIVTTPIPYQYLHMLNVLLFFFVYSVPFVFTANFKWVTPFPSAVVALAFYGVNEIGRCMEDPFSWEEPCHDLSAAGWRSYRENAQIHADADAEAEAEAQLVSKKRGAIDGNGRARADSGHSAVSDVKDDDETRSTTASETDASRGERGRRNTLRFLGDVSGTDVDDGDDDDAAVVDPGMLPKELSTHWTGFITEIFVFRDTVMPTLLPQILVAFALGVAAQIVKMRACGADVVAAAECQTTFDITGHQVVSVSLGFLLVFRTDWAYDRYYEGKASLGQLYGGMRNLNVLFVNFLRENRPGECAAFARAARTSNVDGRLDPGAAERGANMGKVTARTSEGSAAGTYDERDAERTPAERVKTARRVRRDRAELLRLTNVMYAVMRHALRELRVGRASTSTSTSTDANGFSGKQSRFCLFGRFARAFRTPPVRPRSDTECVLDDSSGSPRLPTYLRAGEASTLLRLSPSNRHNWIAMRVQDIVETNRRLGFIGERAAFEIYQELESCLAAYKAMERIVSTPIPHTYTHMLQLILFFFVFSAPFVFTTTFHWIGFVPSVIVAVGFYGVNEIGKLIQDPFDWRQPCHDLSGMGRRAFEENLRLHECAEAREQSARRDGRRREEAKKKRRREKKHARAVRRRAVDVRDERSESGSGSDDDVFFRDEVSLSTLREALEGKGVVNAFVEKEKTRCAGDATGHDAKIGGHDAKVSNEFESSRDGVLARLAPIPALEYAGGPWAFVTTLFRVRGTVLPRVFPQVLFAVVSSLCAQTLKIYWCGADIVSHAQCSLAFSETAHAVAGGVIGFMLVFRTSISYYRFYEGKKYLGHLHDALRNANVAFCAFLRTNASQEARRSRPSRPSRSGNTREESLPDRLESTRFDEALNRDRVELRRLSNVLFAFVRQSVRERRHGYAEGCRVRATETSLLRDDVYGAPSLSTLLDERERDEFADVDPENRANVVVWRMQSIVERHRRLGNVCERGAFDIYHDLEACLEAHKHMERVVSTKMPFQYLHAVNFLLFVFVFSAPFVFTTGFKWLSPVPSCIVAVAFYGVAEVARSIEDPYSWEQPCHDLSGVGWRLYVESLELHEASVAGEDARGAEAGDAPPGTDARDGARETDVSVVTVTTTANSEAAKGKPEADEADEADDETTSRAKKMMKPKPNPRRRRRVSVAHGAADRALVASGRPDPRVAMEAARAREKTENETRRFVPDDGGPSGDKGGKAARAASAPAAPELSNSRFGFFYDVFRVRGTVHGDVFPQVTLAFAVGWAAQLAKLWRCGGMVQEAYECAVTFEPHAHAVVGSVLAFMIVYRFKFAYDRYYEAKTAISELHCGLRNFNIGACAFLRLDEAPANSASADAKRPGDSARRDRGGMFFWKKKDASLDETNVGGRGAEEDPSPLIETAASSLLRERTELLRLSGALFGFLRHRLREHRLGYPWNASPGDLEVLTDDVRGSPRLGTLLRDADELHEFGSVPFRNRPNVAATKMQVAVERLRRRGETCERGAFDLYRECERVLAALTSCERIVETPVPFQYVQMSHFVTFFFVYSAPFIFTTSYQYISFFPSCLLAMAFYGINCIGEVIERPFDWREPNHDLAGIGRRVWRECAQLHSRCAAHDARTIAEGDDAHDDARRELERLVERAEDGEDDQIKISAAPTTRDAPTTFEETRSNQPRFSQFHAARARRASASQHARLLAAREYPRETFSFLTGLFSGSSNALRRATPQVVAAAATGVVANAAKRLWCGAHVSRSSECALTFHTEAHAICGAIIGFLLVFCANIAYVKFYEAKTAAGAVYHGLRNVNVCAASFLRPAERGEPGYVEDERERELQMDQTRRDVREINRLVDVLFAFLRTALRERRHGYRVAKNASGGSGKKNGGWRKTRGGGTGFVPDELLVTEDLTGSPSLSTLLFTDAERAKYLTLDPLNRFNVAVADLHRAVERRRETGALYEKAAHEMYRECDVVLAAYKTCERVVTTPIPYQYMHMVNLVLFCFVFSAPFVFSATFDWLTPLPSAVLALGFYGIWEVGKTMMDPFDWNSPCVDLTAIGRRVADEGGGIARAAREEAEKNAHVPGHPAGARGDASGE